MVSKLGDRQLDELSAAAAERVEAWLQDRADKQTKLAEARGDEPAAIAASQRDWCVSPKQPDNP
eukprot:COSAG05_NODE_8028_length_744_cov_1.003101_2_plen_64_part_00